MSFNPGGSGGGSGSIAGSTDVSLSSLQDNHILAYDQSTDKWQNSHGVATIDLNVQTGTSYSLVLADAGRFITFSNSSPATLIVPINSSVAFPIGARVTLAQIGTGQVTIQGAGGVTINADPGLSIAARYGAAELIKLATNTWLAVGRLSA